VIDWQRFIDSPYFLPCVFAVVIAFVLGGGVGCLLFLGFRRVTAHHLAQKWFGETQRQVVDLTSEVSQLKNSNTYLSHKVSAMRGYSKQVARHMTELADGDPTERTKRRTA
jgi:hypothetical protein